MNDYRPKSFGKTADVRAAIILERERCARAITELANKAGSTMVDLIDVLKLVYAGEGREAPGLDDQAYATAIAFHTEGLRSPLDHEWDGARQPPRRWAIVRYDWFGDDVPDEVAEIEARVNRGGL